MKVQFVRIFVFTQPLVFKILYGSSIFICLLLITASIRPFPIIIDGLLSFLLAKRAVYKLYYKNSYFVNNIKLGQCNVTKKYALMFKTGCLPEERDEQEEYLTYLKGLEEKNMSSMRGVIAESILLLSLYVLVFVLPHHDSYLIIYIGLFLALVSYASITSRIRFNKVLSLRSEIYLQQLKNNRSKISLN
jgi:hypothetical protein